MKALSRTLHSSGASSPRTSSTDDKTTSSSNLSHESTSEGKEPPTSVRTASSSGSSVTSSARSSSGSSGDGSSAGTSSGSSFSGSGNGNTATTKKTNRSFSSSLTSISSTAMKTLSLNTVTHSRCIAEDEEEEAIMNYLKNSVIPNDPIDFISKAYAPLFNTTEALPKHMQGRYKCKKKRNVPFELVKEHHIPRYFSEDFEFDSNGENFGLDALLGHAEHFHNSDEKRRMRTIERAAVINKATKQTLEKASVFFHDEAIHHPNDGNDDPVHMHIYSIVTVEKGKIVHDHIVLDQSPMAHRHAEVSCSIQ